MSDDIRTVANETAVAELLWLLVSSVQLKEHATTGRRLSFERDKLRRAASELTTAAREILARCEDWMISMGHGEYVERLKKALGE